MRKICVFSATRAEYGLLKGLLEAIRKSQVLQLQILASGMHVSPEFGLTIQEIRADGFNVDETVEMLLSGDTPTAICKSMGVALIGYGEALDRLKPDMLVVLGDRFEALCIAAAAHVCGISIAHIHGGETTEGAIDDAFRHSITKMSYLHFASCEPYRRRIIQLGETPDRVFNVGALGVENIRRTILMERDELGESIGFNLDRPYFMVTFHPVTLDRSSSEEQFQELLQALDAFMTFNVVFTGANADPEGRAINRLISEYTVRNPGRCLVAISLGMRRYLSAMKHCTAVVGNSSSGILEAPSLKVPTVNIGDRQKGRIQAASILNCEPKSEAIRQTVDRAVSHDFQKGLLDVLNPYDMPGTYAMIVGLLENIDTSSIAGKTFYDLSLS